MKADMVEWGMFACIMLLWIVAMTAVIIRLSSSDWGCAPVPCACRPMESKPCNCCAGCRGRQ